MERVATDPTLHAALALSQRHGMLGSRPIAEVIDQATAFVPPLGELPAGARLVDLGSGGGVPGLVIAWLRPDLSVGLVERRGTRADHLRRLVLRLDLAEHVRVLAVDAAELPALLPGPVRAVVARGFGPPESLLDAAAAILSPAGLLIVSEPPNANRPRWTAAVLGDRFRFERTGETRVAVLRRSS